MSSMEANGAQPEHGRGRIAALDGLRALAVVAVLAYHQGFRWARGGYLGVSSFFTLSGFLITGLLVAERDRTGRVGLGGFWSRRARRLLPAALLTLVAVAVAQALTRHWTSVRLRGDLFGALGYVANWRFATAPGGYAALFSQASPVQHFWSLGVEEQFYLAFPLLVLGVWWSARRLHLRSQRVLAAALAALALGSFAIAWSSAARGANDGFGYYATTHRAGELLVGALGALWWARPRRRAVPSAVVGLAGVAGLAWLVVAWSTVGLGDRFLFRGGVEANALATVAVILACLVPGPVSRMLSWRPVAGLGRISYGVYLFHWPLFAFVSTAALGVRGWWLFLARCAVVVALATVSFFVLEEPIRTGRAWARGRVRGPRLALAYALVLVAVAGAIGLARPPRGTTLLDFSASKVESAPLSTVSAPSPVAYQPLRLLLVGDSLAYTLLPGLKTWVADHPAAAATLSWRLSMGCPLSGQAIVKLGGKSRPTFPDCSSLVDDGAAKMTDDHPDAALVVGGLADLGDHRFESGPLADGRWHHLGEPAFDQWVLARLQRAADLWQARGLHVVWATMPAIRVEPLAGGDGTASENDPARRARFNDLVRLAAGGRPNFTVADFAGWMDALPGGALDPRWRSDGVHLTVPAGTDAAAKDLMVAVYAALGRPTPPVARPSPVRLTSEG